MVQVAAFQRADRAQAMVERLRSQGFPAFVAKDAAAEALNRVLIGPVRKAEDAEAFRSRLAASGYQALVRRQSLSEVAKGPAEPTEPAESRPAAAPGASMPTDNRPEPGAIQ